LAQDTPATSIEALTLAGLARKLAGLDFSARLVIGRVCRCYIYSAEDNPEGDGWKAYADSAEGPGSAVICALGMALAQRGVQ
jgi:hypothetical protein